MPSTVAFISSIFVSSFSFRSSSSSFTPPRSVLQKRTPYQCFRCYRVTLPVRTRRVLSMRNRRSSHEFSPSIERIVAKTKKLWKNASPSERLTIGAAAMAGISVAGIAVNVLFHVSLALAFSIIPILLAPIFFTIMASLTLFAVLSITTAGLGMFLVGSPFLVASLVGKILFPGVLILGGASLLIGRLLGFSKSEEVDKVLDDFDEEEDAFERFDQELRDRKVQKSWNVARWSLNDVIDELDYRGLGEYRQLFIDERIDGAVLLELTEGDIKNEFGSLMPLGHRMRLMRLVNDLQKRASRVA